MISKFEDYLFIIEKFVSTRYICRDIYVEWEKYIDEWWQENALVNQSSIRFQFIEQTEKWRHIAQGLSVERERDPLENEKKMTENKNKFIGEEHSLSNAECEQKIWLGWDHWTREWMDEFDIEREKTKVAKQCKSFWQKNEAFDKPKIPLTRMFGLFSMATHREESSRSFTDVDVRDYICRRNLRSDDIHFDHGDFDYDGDVSSEMIHANPTDFDDECWKNGESTCRMNDRIVVLPWTIRFIFDAFQRVLQRTNQDFTSIIVRDFRLFYQRDRRD